MSLFSIIWNCWNYKHSLLAFRYDDTNYSPNTNLLKNQKTTFLVCINDWSSIQDLRLEFPYENKHLWYPFSLLCKIWSAICNLQQLDPPITVTGRYSRSFKKVSISININFLWHVRSKHINGRQIPLLRWNIGCS